MNLLSLAWRSLANRRFAVVLTVCTIALSIALLVLVEHLRSEVRESFYRSVSGTDLIVGARTAPVQLLLASVFGIGQTTNTLSFETWEAIAARDEVDWAVPLAMGDYYRGHRVVGTTPEFFEHYRYADRQALQLARGAAFDDLFAVVVGHQVARRLDHGIGDELHLAHGGGSASLQEHDDHPFTVTGILAPTGTPVDRNVYIPLAAQEAIHVGWESGVRRPGAVLEAEDARQRAGELHPEGISAGLLGLHSRAAAFGLQRTLNEYPDEALSAIMPGLTLQALWRISSLAEQVLRVVAAMVVVAGLLGMLTVLLTTLAERRREMAILRANGARPWQIGALLLFEAALIALAGIAAGVVVALAAQWLAAPWLLARFGLAIGGGWPGATVWAVLGGIWLAGIAVALIPAIMAYRQSLADGMRVRM